jgi:hypothetical protein
MIDKNCLLRYELRPEDLSPSSHAVHVIRRLFCHEAEAMPPESLTSCAAYCTYPSFFTVGLHFHGYTGCFFRVESDLETRSILENPLLCSGWAWMRVWGRTSSFKLGEVGSWEGGPFVDSTLISIFPKWSLTEGRSRNPSRGMAPAESPLAGV